MSPFILGQGNFKSRINSSPPSSTVGPLNPRPEPIVFVRKLFDDMPHGSVVSWTATISRYCKNGCFREALETFSSMRRSGCEANEFTYGSALKACAGLSCIASGQQIHGCAAKSGYVGDTLVRSALMDAHLKCGSVDDAWRLFDGMLTRDAVAWNSMIGGCAARGMGEDAFAVFFWMVRDGRSPDHFTFGNVLKGCSVIRNLKKVKQIHAFIIKLGHDCHHVVSGSLINAYAKCKSLDNAALLYEYMGERDLISSTALITGLSVEKNSGSKAFDLFREICRMGMKIDNVILSSMLNICADASCLQFGGQIHAHIVKKHLYCDIVLGNALIDMYAKSGELKGARRAFDEIECRNVVSWTSLITGYGQNGYGEVAVALFESMENEGVKPNDITFVSLLSACSHSGLVSKGMEHLNFMVTKYGIQPRAEHYCCVVDLLARNGQLKDAYSLVCKMNTKPNTSIWGAILGACKIYGDISISEVAAGDLLDLCPQKSANYVVLANIYAIAGLWEAATNIRKMLKQLSLQKDVGCSYI